MSDAAFILLSAIVVVAFLCLGLAMRTLDALTWNNGICKENGLPWEYFDSDSQGGRGYKAGGHTCWISWPGVDDKKKIIKKFLTFDFFSLYYKCRKEAKDQQ